MQINQTTFDYIIVVLEVQDVFLLTALVHAASTAFCLEAGGRDWHPILYIPAGFMKTLVNPNFNWMYESSPSEGTNGRIIPAPRGKVLGGSSSINGMGFNRGQKMDFDVWAQMGIQDGHTMTYSHILSALKAMFQKKTRVIGGPLERSQLVT